MSELVIKVIPQYCVVHPYCARFWLHSVARANERNNYPQAKLDCEINVLFLLNKYVDLYFLSHNNSVHIILFNLKTKIKKSYRTEKRT